MPNQIPEQREAALKLAKNLIAAYEECSIPGEVPDHDALVDVSRALLDLHAENVRLREALKRISMTCGDRSNTETDLRVKVICICQDELNPEIS